MNLETSQLSGLVSNYIVPLGWKILGAVVVWIVGGWIIGWIRRLVAGTLRRKQTDPTLASYLDTVVGVGLRVLLAIVVLGVLGVETTSFAAIIAAAGLAVGMAWSGLLANFAAGVFLLVLRPFAKGDMISAGGVTGEVVNIGLFATTLNTAENHRVTVGNNKIFSDNITNYTANPFRAVDLSAQLAHTTSVDLAKDRLRAALNAIPNVCRSPAPVVEIGGFTEMGPKLIVRPFCHNKDYWQVYFDTNRAILDSLSGEGFPIPETRQAVRQVA